MDGLSSMLSALLSASLTKYFRLQRIHPSSSRIPATTDSRGENSAHSNNGERALGELLVGEAVKQCSLRVFVGFALSNWT